MSDKPSAPLSGELLARKGAASSDGFAFGGDTPDAKRRTTDRWRVALYSATLVLSVIVIGMVATTLILIGSWPQPAAPKRVAVAPSAPAPAAPVPERLALEELAPKEPVPEMHAAEKSPPDAVETPVPVAVQTPTVSEPKPLAEAVTSELGKQHAEKLLPTPAPETNLAATKAMPASIPAAKKPAQTATWVPPRPKKRPPRASPPASRGKYRIQLHALASDAAVRREWRRLRQRYGALLGDLELTVTPVRPKAGKTIYRMQLGALSNLSQARTLCKKLRRKKLNCLVVR